MVAAVCHGPAALVNLTLSNGSYLVDGKEVSAFTNAEEEAVRLTNVVPFLLQTALEDRRRQTRGRAELRKPGLCAPNAWSRARTRRAPPVRRRRWRAC